MSGGFQQQVYNAPRPAVAGDFASQNPYYSFDAGPGGLVAGDSLHVGRFAWVTAPLDPNGTGMIANSYGTGPVAEDGGGVAVVPHRRPSIRREGQKVSAAAAPTP